MKLPNALIFAALFIMAISSCPGQTKPADSGTGIEGVITISPTHGGPIHENEPAAKALPNTEFSVQNDKGEVASFTTDDQGKFKVSLAPGHYTVSKKNGKARIGSYGPFEVDVTAGKMTRVEWQCDSGMR